MEEDRNCVSSDDSKSSSTLSLNLELSMSQLNYPVTIDFDPMSFPLPSSCLGRDNAKTEDVEKENGDYLNNNHSLPREISNNTSLTKFTTSTSSNTAESMLTTPITSTGESNLTYASTNRDTNSNDQANNECLTSIAISNCESPVAEDVYSNRYVNHCTGVSSSNLNKEDNALSEVSSEHGCLRMTTINGDRCQSGDATANHSKNLSDLSSSPFPVPCKVNDVYENACAESIPIEELKTAESGLTNCVSHTSYSEEYLTCSSANTFGNHLVSSFFSFALA